MIDLKLNEVAFCLAVAWVLTSVASCAKSEVNNQHVETMQQMEYDNAPKI